MKKERVKNWLFFAYIVAILLFSVLLIPFVTSLKSEDGILALEETVKSFGAFGIILIFIIQVLQIVVIIIPGEVIEFVSGAMYGTFFGFLIDIAGIVVGETIIYFIVKKLGASVVRKVASSKRLQRFKFLKNTKKVEILLFFLYFIPGTPKDFLCYAAPLFEIPFKPFLIISTIARIPSVLSSTYAGAAFGDGNVFKTALVYAVILVLSIAGILINNAIMKGKESNGAER